MKTSEQSISAWVVKGLGGACNMVADLSESGIKIDGDHLKDLRSCIVRLAAHYNYHAQRSSLEPHERPRFFGADHSYTQMVQNGQLGSTQAVTESTAVGNGESVTDSAAVEYDPARYRPII